MTRAVLRFVPWTISPDMEPDAEPVTHAMRCAVCGQQSVAFEEIGPAQLWALQHAGRARDHHTFREVLTRPWRAWPAEGTTL